MPEPTDAVLPILRRIQENLAETRREVGRNTRLLETHGEKLESIEAHLVYHLGLTSRDRADLQARQAKVKAMDKRLAALERSPRGNGPKRK